MSSSIKPTPTHSNAWIFQAWACFVISAFALGVGILNLPVDRWTRSYMGIGALFAIASTLNLAKTTRDLHEARKFTTRVDEARLEKLLSEHPTP